MDDYRISDSVKMALKKAHLTEKKLAEKFELTEHTINQKFSKSTWNGSDLARIAEFTGGELAFTYPDGSIIPIYIDKDIRRRISSGKSPKDEIKGTGSSDSDSKHLSEDIPSEDESPIFSDHEVVLQYAVQNDAGIEDKQDSETNEKTDYKSAEDTVNNTASLQQEEETPNDYSSLSPIQNDITESETSDDPKFSGDYRPVNNDINNTLIVPSSIQGRKDAYMAKQNKSAIIILAEQIINHEAPIHMDILIEKILALSNVRKADDTIKHTKSVLNTFREFHRNKVKSNVFFWKKNTDPENYKVFRIGEKNLDKVCLYDLKNSICYALKQNTQKNGTTRMDEDDLIKAVATSFKISRLRSKTREVLIEALSFSRTVNAIEGKGQISLKERESSVKNHEL